ncbi:hypothetical protein FRC09_017440 [Ceratobasidium sp. 395]|nr:hypothetical protein FRC09_017440 [Ceratobasidium sp. 395]
MSVRETILNHSRRSIRDGFIGSWLTSSSHASAHIQTLSELKDRGRMFPIKFDSGWGHEGCLVKEWYSQQCQSNTRFRAIEHRQNLDGPFFHQFLLLKLADGAICRVERTGEGFRACAVRYVGCTANDFIQWFPNSNTYDVCYVNSPSKCIAKIDLGQEFDILDVLAICYSIQNTKACRAYTLQRYNCYFLCLTVLAVLTRRMASWETRIEAEKWDLSLTSMYEHWSSLSPKQAEYYPILRICAYLEPDNPRRAQFVSNILREHLGSQAEGFVRCNVAVRLTLWRADWRSGLLAGLLASLKADPDPFKDTSYCSQQLKRAVETSRSDAERAIMSCKTLLVKNYFKVMAEESAKLYAMRYKQFKSLQRLWQIEHPVSLGRLASSQVVGSLAGLRVFFAAPSGIYADSSHTRRLHSQISMRVAMLKQESILSTSRALNALKQSNEQEQSDALDILWDKARATVNDEACGALIARVLDRLASAGILTPSEVSLLLAFWLDEHDPAAFLAWPAAPDLENILFSSMQPCQTEIRLTLGKPELAHTSMPIDEFQETYIKGRIAAYARRVAIHQLAAEKLVIEDVEEAMRQVWKGLPLGFGAVGLASSLEADETVKLAPATRVLRACRA